MSVSDGIFHAHGVHDALDALDQELGLLEPPKGPADDPTVARFISIAALIRSILDGVDPQFVSPAMLDAIAADVGSAGQRLAEFRETRNAEAIRQTQDDLDKVLSTLGWGAILGPASMEGIQEAATSYRRSVGQLARAVRADAEALHERVQQVSGDVESLSDRIAAEVERVSDQVEARFSPLSQRVDQVAATVERQAARLDTAITEFQAQFSKTEENRRERFEAFVAEKTTASDTVIADATKELDAIQAAHKERADEIVESMTRYEAQAAELASMVAGLGVAGGYGKYAATEERYANNWRWIGIGLAALGTAWVVYTILPLLGTPSIAGIELSFLARLLGATPIFLLALYAFRESSKHRRASRDARSTALQFAAFEPFISLLPRDHQTTVRTQMAERLFQPLAAPVDEPSESVLDIAAKLIDRIPKP